MTDQNTFESRKNLRAGIYTAIVCGCILGLCLLMSWTMPPLPQPPIEEGIEVNLGNSDDGSGTDQPFEPGPPAPTNQTAYVPPQPVVNNDNDVKDIETNDKDEDAPVIKKPADAKPKATKVPEKETVKTKPAAKPKPETPPAPPAPRPKAVMKGVSGTGGGGNEADSYKKGRSEGIGSGSGDMGRPGGNPDSKNYTGGGGNGNVVRGNRRIISGSYSFTGEFNRDATVYAEIRVDASGRGTYLRVGKGSTTTDRTYIDEIIRRLREIKFNTASSEDVVTVKFNFKVTR